MKIEKIITTDLSDFGNRELTELALLIKAMDQQGLPKDFDRDGVTSMFNMNSGNVFLTNSNYEVAMLNGDKLESFYSCPQCGHEGFLEDMEHAENDTDCQEYLKQIKEVK